MFRETARIARQLSASAHLEPLCPQDTSFRKPRGLIARVLLWFNSSSYFQAAQTSSASPTFEAGSLLSSSSCCSVPGRPRRLSLTSPQERQVLAWTTSCVTAGATSSLRCLTGRSLVLQTIDRGVRDRCCLLSKRRYEPPACPTWRRRWGKSAGDPLIRWSRSGPWSKTSRSCLRNNLREERKGRRFIYSLHRFFSVSCSVKRKMWILMDTKPCSSLRSFYPPFQLIKPEIKTSICFPPMVF